MKMGKSIVQLVEEAKALIAEGVDPVMAAVQVCHGYVDNVYRAVRDEVTR